MASTPRRKVCVVTGSRADYGLLHSLLRSVQADAALELQLLVTGMHLAPEFGLTWRAIEADGLRIDAQVDMLLAGDTPVATAKSMGLGVIGAVDALERLAPDVVVVLGDRFEMFAVAQAALVLRIPIAHIHGGEISEGAFDESLRHAVTKMAQWHFVAAEPYRQRVVQLGEAPARVFNFGAPGLDALDTLDWLDRPALERSLGIALDDPVLLVTYHPETLSHEDPCAPMDELLGALAAFPEATIVFTYPNADAGGRALIDRIDRFVQAAPARLHAFASLGQQRYLSLMRIARLVLGNSSSGLIEAPALKVACVNIGDRQKGRLKASCVIDTTAVRGDIESAIRLALSPDFRAGLAQTVSLYGQGQAGERIKDCLKTVPLDVRKPFHDLVPGADMAITIIAEAGVNHNGSLAMALQLVDAAARAGADAAKFQTFSAAQLVTRDAPKADYQLLATASGESQFEMLRRLELSQPDHQALLAHARACGIAFLSTPFDSASLRLLVETFGLTTIKVSSGDLTNAPFLLEIARAAQRVILSSGMATQTEVEAALGVLAFGWTAPASAPPSRAAFEAAWATPAGQQAVRERAVLLHCTTEYPAPVDEVNLRAMDSLADAFGLPVGYSDHTQGIHIAIAAAARGATVIEKHFTLNRELPGPDHKASLEPAELAAMVNGIREVERALGDGVKRPTPSEMKNRNAARKSLVAARALQRGEPLELACKRPGGGRSPFDFWALSGREAKRDYAPDEAVDD